ncbi:MAG TPA: restriction endonuclease [Caldisericia bacterium]|nr:restriction endonuclease [Caldisericia bacterium]HRV75699.1 restriction endonuclease [Caldisericia bacterium]
MTIPNFQEFMLPVLMLMSDGKQREYREIIYQTADLMNISEEDKLDMIPSGREPRYVDRTGWSIQYLKQAGLLKAIKRGLYIITDEGKKVSGMNIKKIDISFLDQYESFRDFKKRANTKGEGNNDVSNNEDSTPEEQIESIYLELKTVLIDDIIDKLQHVNPKNFEYLVVKLLEKMGYGAWKGAGRVTGKPNDQGIDGVIDQDRLGLDKVYIQAKRWQGSVGSKEIQGFVGALVKQNSMKGVFITTGSFTKEALDFASHIGKNMSLSLIDGVVLAKLMIEHNLGLIVHKKYELMKIDENFFDDI